MAILQPTTAAAAKRQRSTLLKAGLLFLVGLIACFVEKKPLGRACGLKGPPAPGPNYGHEVPKDFVPPSLKRRGYEPQVFDAPWLPQAGKSWTPHYKSYETPYRVGDRIRLKWPVEISYAGRGYFNEGGSTDINADSWQGKLEDRGYKVPDKYQMAHIEKTKKQGKYGRMHYPQWYPDFPKPWTGVVEGGSEGTVVRIIPASLVPLLRPKSWQRKEGKMGYKRLHPLFSGHGAYGQAVLLVNFDDDKYPVEAVKEVECEKIGSEFDDPDLPVFANDEEAEAAQAAWKGVNVKKEVDA